MEIFSCEFVYFADRFVARVKSDSQITRNNRKKFLIAFVFYEASAAVVFLRFLVAIVLCSGISGINSANTGSHVVTTAPNLLNSYFQTNLMLEYRVYCRFIKSRRSTTAEREIFNNSRPVECSNMNNTAPPD